MIRRTPGKLRGTRTPACQGEPLSKRHLQRQGRVAQWESARFTRERSQVRNPPRPSWKALHCGAFCVGASNSAETKSPVLAETLAETRVMRGAYRRLPSPIGRCGAAFRPQLASGPRTRCGPEDRPNPGRCATRPVAWIQVGPRSCRSCESRAAPRTAGSIGEAPSARAVSSSPSDQRENDLRRHPLVGEGVDQVDGLDDLIALVGRERPIHAPARALACKLLNASAARSLD
jgi:hypothetical protein